MTADRRPVLWTGELACTCGFRAQASVLGRRGHRYDELEAPAGLDAGERAAFEDFVHESYTAEGRGVLDVARCPKCGRRPGLGRELRRMGLWLAVVCLMSGAVAAVLFAFGDRRASVAALVAAGVVVLGRGYTFAAQVREAHDRVRLEPEASAPRSARDGSASSA